MVRNFANQQKKRTFAARFDKIHCMTSNHNTDSQSLVLRIAQFFEQQGLSLSEGRVLGLLMVSEHKQLDFNDIQQQLGLSKSTTSTTLKNLIARRLIDQMQPDGSRKRYFRLHPPLSCDDIIDRIERMKAFATEILELHKPLNHTEKISTVQHIIAGYEIIIRHIQMLKQEFAEKQYCADNPK